MSIREHQKQITREKLLENTKSLILDNGFVKVSTKDISRASGVSQGTIFLHFNTKDNLLNVIFSSFLNELEIALTEGCNPKMDRELFLRDLFDIISLNENMLSRVYKDYAYLPLLIKKGIDQLEVKLKNLLFDNLRFKPTVTISIVDSFINIDAFYAQIKVNLQEKETYTEFNSVIKQKRGKLIKLYRTLFE